MEALDFLKKFRPKGWLNIVSIHPESEDVTGLTVNVSNPEEWQRVQSFINIRKDTENLYFTVNEPKAGAPHSKLKKDDIETIHCFYTDTDPEKNKDPAEERTRLETLTHAIVNDNKAPCSFAIDSGGGFQQFWMLQEPVPADKFREVAESIGRKLAYKLNADSIHNIDRLMRIPGTMNLPGPKKRERGRTPQPTKLVAWQPQHTYAPTDFMNMPDPPIKDDLGDALTPSDVDTSALQQVATLDDISLPLRNKFDSLLRADKYLRDIWNGNDECLSDKSRSGFDFALVRALSGYNLTPTELAILLKLNPHGKGADLTLREILRTVGRASQTTPKPEDDFPVATTEGPKPLPLTTFNPKNLPPRKWIYGEMLVRRYISMLIAPPGSSKTQFTIASALAIASGKPILGIPVRERTRVAIFNNEDSLDELRRRIAAEMQNHSLTFDDLMMDGKPALYVNSGEQTPMSFAKVAQNKRHLSIEASADVQTLRTFLMKNNIGVFTADPFVEMHEADENDNNQVAKVAQILRALAWDTNSAAWIVHHTRKPPEASSDHHVGNMDSGRGASSLAGAARFVHTLYTMSDKDAKKYNIPKEDKNFYIRLDNAKANMAAPSSQEKWFKRASQQMACYVPADQTNDCDEDGMPVAYESVGVLTPTTLTAAEDDFNDGKGISVRDIYELLLTHPGHACPTVEVARQFASSEDKRAYQSAYKRVERLTSAPVWIDDYVLRAAEPGEQIGDSQHAYLTKHLILEQR